MNSKYLILSAILLFSAILTGCGTKKLPNRNPVGNSFPIVTGNSLQEEPFTIPSDIESFPVVLIVGYKQNSQFDIDRWILGITQSDSNVALYEIPTLPGLATKLAKGYIDSGMRSGIPERDWDKVITVYGDAKKITELTGTTNPNNARVLLLSENNEIIWFHDQGYSITDLLDLKEKIESSQNDN